MTTARAHHWPMLAVAAALLAVLIVNIAPYEGNVTSVFHMDAVLEEDNPLPSGFVVLGIPSYDGAQYYQVARNIPEIADPSAWPELRSRAPGSYAYQRFLLPLAAFIFSFGQESALPYAFIGINIAALLLTAWLMLRTSIRPLYVFALTLSPAAMVAMHFTLAEPLTILLLTIVLLRYSEKERLTWLDSLLLSLFVLAREVNILLIAFFMGYSLLRLRWRDLALLTIPALTFLGWHTVIYQIFGNVPFLISAGANQLPGSAAMKLVLGMRGYSRFTLSAIALFVGVVIPGIVWAVLDMVRARRLDILPLGALAFFGVMLLMPDYIWGSITSIGRVITPVYPLYVLSLARRDGSAERTLAFAVLVIGVAAAAGLAASVHPFVMSV